MSADNLITRMHQGQQGAAERVCEQMRAEGLQREKAVAEAIAAAAALAEGIWP